MQQKRLKLAGDTSVGTEFPLDILAARGLISREMQAAGHRFAATAWALFGAPSASCEALYARMIAIVDNGVAPVDSVEDRSGINMARHRAMVSELQPAGSSRAALNAVQNAAQFLRLPRYAANLASGHRNRPSDYREMAALVEGLERLVKLENGEARRAA